MTEMTETGVFPQSFYNLSLKDTLGEKQYLGHLGHRPLMKIRPPMMPHPPYRFSGRGRGAGMRKLADIG
jgi:hypothetical protein